MLLCISDFADVKVTPFDVLKTRLQTVRPHPRHAGASPVQPAPLSTECCQTSVLTSPRARFPSNSGGTNPLTCVSSASSGTATLNPAAAELSFSSLRSSATPIAPPSGCLHPSKWAGIWGETIALERAMTRMGAGGASLVLPMEGAGTGAIGGFWSELATVRRETGVKGLWKGVGTTL